MIAVVGKEERFHLIEGEALAPYLVGLQTPVVQPEPEEAAAGAGAGAGGAGEGVMQVE